MQQCFRNPQQESKLRDFSTNSFQNSPYSRFIQEGLSQDIERDDNIPLSQNSMPFENYRRFLQQEPTSKNLIFKNYINNSPKYLGRQEFSQDKPAREYPFAHSLVLPSRQAFDRSENLFFRNPRNKYSEFLLGDYTKTQDYIKDEEDPTSEVQVMYRADKDVKPESSFPKVENIYQPRQEKFLDRERNMIEKFSNSASQLRYPQERYNPIEFDPSEVKRDSHIKDIKDTDVPKSTKEFFNNWDIARDSSQSLNLEQRRNNFLEVHPAKKQKIIDEKINFKPYNTKFPQDLDIWKHLENEEDAEDMKEYFDDRTEPFQDEDLKEYFEDEAEQLDTIGTEQNNYNPRILSQNIWKGTESDEFLDNLDFISENSQETEQLGLNSEENDNYLFFEDEKNKDVIFQDKADTTAETARAPVINAYNAYILPRYLNIVNDKKYPSKSEAEELSEVKGSLRTNSVKEMNHRFLEDDAVIDDNKRIQDLILSKDIFNVEEYSNPIDERNNVRNKNEALTELDPDLLDDIEDPPVGTTESIPT